ncbi:MAG: DUF1573 domain-containing protein [Nitrospirae bacterium]|nr:DUF1573 domain-containing protein [Nitrospirota bacterium]
MPPGAEGVITVKVNTAGMSGRISKTFDVRTNDPENPSVMLVVYGIVKQKGESNAQ